MLSRKDVVEANKMFHTGRITNESSLAFALDQIHRSKNWLKTVAILARAILTDHIVEDGNKRTAAAIIETIMDMQNIPYDVEKVNHAVLTITRKNLTSIKVIEKVISNARN